MISPSARAASAGPALAPSLVPRALSAFVLIALALTSTPSLACEESHDNVSQDEVLRMTETGRIEPFPRILEKARRHRSGKLLEAKLDCIDKRYVYEIDMLDHDGEIRALRFDAVTGRHLNLKKD